MIETRPAGPDDFQSVASLLAELGRPDVLGPEDGEWARHSWKRYLSREDTLCFVAYDEDKVIGFIDVEFRQRLNMRSMQAWVPDLIVSEDARSKGAGRLLLEEAVAAAKERGCFGITLESAVWRERAHAFYEREGWQTSAKSLNLSLSETPWPPPARADG
ncbi:MAG: GNAT family N-acetyltransferase [Actinomycetota bacterium]